jgi:hypothetical protein
MEEERERGEEDIELLRDRASISFTREERNCNSSQTDCKFLNASILLYELSVITSAVASLEKSDTHWINVSLDKVTFVNDIVWTTLVKGRGGSQCTTSKVIDFLILLYSTISTVLYYSQDELMVSYVVEKRAKSECTS